jgi:sugar lactone lactonase YvrE
MRVLWMRKMRWKSFAVLARAASFGAAVASALAALAAPPLSLAAPAAGTIVTVAGMGRFNGDNIPASQATLGIPFGQGLTGIAGHPRVGLAVDSAGNLYIADALNNRVRKVSVGPDGTTLTGTITTVAGTGVAGFGGDGGPATQAQLNFPTSVAIGPDGSLYIADSGNRRIRKVAPNGTISTYAGTGAAGSSGNEGPATKATFGSGPIAPTTASAGSLTPAVLGVAVGPDGSVYVADQARTVVRKITPDGIIHAFAGKGVGGDLAANGDPATNMKFDTPVAVTVAPNGTVYIVDRGNHKVKAVDPQGRIYNFVGTGDRETPTAIGDGGIASRARLGFPLDVAVDSSGNLYIADQAANRIRLVVPPADQLGATEKQSTSLTTYLPDFNSVQYGGVTTPSLPGQNVPGRQITVAPGVTRTLFAGQITTLAGKLLPAVTNASGGFATGDSPDGTLAINAMLNHPSAVAVGPDGSVYYADSYNLSIKRIDPVSRTIARVAGGYSGLSGAPTSITLRRPRRVATAPDGSLYIADSEAMVIRKVSPDGSSSTTVAGTGWMGGSQDFSWEGGPATSAPLVWPTGIAVTKDGNTLYIADRGAHRVFKVDNTTGLITTYAGTGNAASTGVGPDPSGAVKATAVNLNYPSDVAVDASGNVYIADTYNSRVLKVDTSGMATLVAGTGEFSYSGDGGSGAAAALDKPNAVDVGPDGSVYIDDMGNACIRRVDSRGIITTFAGTCTTAGFGGDGKAAASALLNAPEGVAVGPDGSVYIADTANQRVRKVATDGTITTVAGSGDVGEGGDGGPATKATFRAPRSVAVSADGKTLYIADSDNGRIRAVGLS